MEYRGIKISVCNYDYDHAGAASVFLYEANGELVYHNPVPNGENPVDFAKKEIDDFFQMAHPAP